MFMINNFSLELWKK